MFLCVFESLVVMQRLIRGFQVHSCLSYHQFNYIIVRELLEGSLIFANLENDRGFISKDDVSIGIWFFRGAESKVIRAYAQSRQILYYYGDP